MRIKEHFRDYLERIRDYRTRKLDEENKLKSTLGDFESKVEGFLENGVTYRELDKYTTDVTDLRIANPHSPKQKKINNLFKRINSYLEESKENLRK